MIASKLGCTGCGATATGDYPFRCPAAGDDGRDHVLVRDLARAPEFPKGTEPNPFARFRRLLYSYQWATARGLTDDQWLRLVDDLDEAVVGVVGRSLHITALRPEPSLGATLGTRVSVKDETANPGGSHKVRHLVGTMLHLNAAEIVGARPLPGPLAIASCGNAALAAAVVARAADRELVVFVPEWADHDVTEELIDLGARLTVCPRGDGQLGDPCVARFRAAVAEGMVPFTCQGPDNALALDGGRTLAWELVEQAGGFARLFVQVGGGALASSLAHGLEDAVVAGVIDEMPALFAVQSEGAYPIVRAFERVVSRAAREGGDHALAYAARHRGEFMWPWEHEPASIATGILDDEVYDWWAIVRSMLVTGGHPIVVSERALKEANAIARRTTGIEVSATGSAGLAGLMTAAAASQRSEPSPSDVVLFTG